MGTDRFLSKAVSGKQAGRIKDIQKAFCAFFDVIDMYIPEGREKSLMITKLEEACMWGAKAISLEKTKDEIKEDVRICSACDEEMYEGYCIHEGEYYYCSPACLNGHFTDQEYQDLYDEGEAYWTSWAYEDTDKFPHEPRIG